VLTTIDGTFIASNGIALPVGAALDGTGTVAAKIAAGFGSRIEATGNLQLGANAANGFYSDGELYTGSNSVTINDSNEAVLGSFTQLGDGAIEGSLLAGMAVPGEAKVRFLLEEGKNLVGRGSISGNFKNNGHVIGDGSGSGERIVFDADSTVSGLGMFENATVLGMFSPGNSPAVIISSNLGLGGTLKIELGGLTPGFGPNNYDQVNDDGAVFISADSKLSLEPWNNFVPTVGDQFQVLTWNQELTGEFDEIVIDPLFSSYGISFSAQYVNPSGAGSLVLTAISVSSPGDFDFDGDIDGRDFLVWQRGGSPSPFSASDLTAWQTGYGVEPLATSHAVPEPAACVILISMFGCIVLLRAR
jgi:hypothetical protein